MQKRRLMVWLGLTISLLLVLAAGLPRMTLSDGAAYAGEWTQQTALGEVDVQPFVVFSLALIAFVVMIYLRRRNWRNFWPTISLVILVLTVFAAIIALAPVIEIEMPVEEEAYPVVEEEVEPETAEPMVEPDIVVVEEPFSPPPVWVSLLVSVLLIFLFLSIMISFVWIYIRLIPNATVQDETYDHEPLSELGRQAQTAAAALRQGRPLADVVLRCYADMEQVLRTGRGIERQQAMTAREFEQQLRQLGLPAEPVETLIHLFEAVRYGRYQPQAQDQARAIDSLTQIVEASQHDTQTI